MEGRAEPHGPGRIWVGDDRGPDRGLLHLNPVRGSSAGTACCSRTPPRGSLVGGSSIFRCCRTPNRRPSSSCTTLLRRLRPRGARVAISWVRLSGPEQEGLASLRFSPRYQSIQRRLKRARYVPQFVVFENEAAKLPELLARRGGADPPRWSLVPGDHDSM